MDFLHGVGNFLWTTTSAAGNLGYSTSKAISEQIFGRSSSGSNTTNISSNGWINSLWYGSNPSSVTSDPRGCGSNPQFDVRRKDIVMMWSRVGSNFVRVAGLSGALAVSMGAYGAHVFHPSKGDEELKQVFEIGNKMHLIHSAALLAVPMTHRPVMAGFLMSVGMLLFCGSCYYHAITGDKSIRWITPYGGALLIFGWVSIAI
ncbi:Transmembrane protein 256 homolog [Acanthosepion pharaonis]|uniref:Transmembrane protein 256 homolog n=1 Tax=Acanthosepion pharaonis TaxID=158019 RepID=A0A812DW08_ACAPH|nr:Transmembrane protein 256 homolog [Sepia pharaonis]